MKRKTLISIALILIMLLNCILPLVKVNAAESKEIQLNAKLYNAIKSSLNAQKISAECSDLTRTIKIADISKVTKLDLNECAISDLTGLENFTSLVHLDLSGNNLTKDSNLNVLNSLSSLDYLDLSTNRLEDVSAITSLINKLKTNGTILLSSQTVEIVESAELESATGDQANNVSKISFNLPSILELAGFLKSNWKDVEVTNQDGSNKISILTAKLPMYVTGTESKAEVTVDSSIAENATALTSQGLVKVTIYIYDDPTEAAASTNINRASENILNGSRFYLYYVIHYDEYEAVDLSDTNIYDAVKKQLTANQTINPELETYKYKLDDEGNQLYNEYEYTTSNGIHQLYLKNTDGSDIKYYYDPVTKTLYSDSDLTNIVNLPVEPVTIVKDDGTQKAGYKIPEISETSSKNLYEAAYDDAKTLVIDDDVLRNKITSLLLNNEQIRDLTGLEDFIGLTSNLDVSHNYIDSIEPIIKLDENKTTTEEKIREEYNYYLSTRSYGNLKSNVEKIMGNKNVVDESLKKFSENNDNIFNAILEVGTATEDAENKASAAADSIKELLNYVRELDNKLQELNEEIHNSGMGLNFNLSKLYDIYNNEYKMTSLLTKNINYQTYPEYQEYKGKTTGTDETVATYESAMGLLTEEFQHLSELEVNNALSDLDVALLKILYPGIKFDDDTVENPVTDFFNERTEKYAYSRLSASAELETLRKISTYSEMANYCLLKRMSNSDYTECFAEEFLNKRIKELELDEVPTNIERGILNHIEAGKEAEVTGSTYTGDAYYNAYIAYAKTLHQYGTTAVKACEGEFIPLYNLYLQNATPYSDAEIITIASSRANNGTTVNEANMQLVLDKLTAEEKALIRNAGVMKDVLQNGSINDAEDLFVYNQVMVLACKLVVGDLSYIELPRLKVLNISHNAELTNITDVSKLTGLSDLNASYDYIADVSNIDWSAMTNLKRLNLSYNFISDISPLLDLSNLKTLNLSNNLIAGELKITEEQYSKLFRRLEELNLSENQISDIAPLITYLDYITGGNYATYLQNVGKPVINLDRQELKLNVTEPIELGEYPTTVNVDLPKIFSQVLRIDEDRVELGGKCTTGRGNKEGINAVLNTRTTGEKEGNVIIQAIDGYNTCIGNGTNITINYKVIDNSSKVKVEVNPVSVTIKPGEQEKFKATVTGEGVTDKNVTWSLSGNQSNNTKIDIDGTLTVGSDETATKITVIATSKADNSAKGEATVTILDENHIAEIYTNKPTILKGESAVFQAIFEGYDVNSNTKINWKVEDNDKPGTALSNEEGEVLEGTTKITEKITFTLAADESDKIIRVTASLSDQPEITAVMYVIPEGTDPDEPTEGGLSLKSNITDNKVEAGTIYGLTAELEAEDVSTRDFDFVWTISGNTSSNTKIIKDGGKTVDGTVATEQVMYSIGADEKSSALTISVAPSDDLNNKKSLTVSVTPMPDNPDDPTPGDDDNPTANINLGYEVEDDYLVEIKPKTPEDNFIETLLGNNKEDYKVVTRSEEGTIVENDFMKTGMTVEIQDEAGNTVKDKNGNLMVYEVVVKGDVNGDGLANSLDSNLIKAHRNEIPGATLIGAEARAADINGDGKINNVDSKLLLYHRAEVKNYNLNY